DFKGNKFYYHTVDRLIYDRFNVVASRNLTRFSPRPLMERSVFDLSGKSRKSENRVREGLHFDLTFSQLKMEGQPVYVF
ncbi:MAG: hypothetical protein PHC64_07965, partial [Candidatus Gastranaerophilales bacterium]|nr:hypothetical protein [Candidatus Gastranaerophilales bacterium]